MNEERTQVVIHAIHGTWQYGYWARIVHAFTGRWPDRPDAWFRDGSEFCSYVKQHVEAEVVWNDTFTWSGRNSFSQRRLASSQFARHLKCQIRAAPDAQHIILAHSHGGTVALGTLAKLHSLGEQRPALIALATPFLSIHRWYDTGGASFSDRRKAMIFPLAALFYLVLWRTQDQWMLPSPVRNMAGTGAFRQVLDFVTIATDATILGFLAASFIAFLRNTSQYRRRWRKSRVFLEHRLASGSKIVAIRGPLDEATLAISVSQFALYIANALARMLAFIPSRLQEYDESYYPFWKLLAWSSVPAMVATVLVVHYDESSMWGAAPLIFLFFEVMFAIIIGVLLPIVFSFLTGLVLFIAMFILAAATGPDLLRLFDSADVECEVIPTGLRGTVTTIAPSAEWERRDAGKKRGLMHSVHEHEQARAAAAFEIMVILKDGAKQPSGT